MSFVSNTIDFFFFFLHILRVNLLVILDLNLSLRRPAVVLFVL